MCLFAIRTQLTRGNNAECVKTLLKAKREQNQSLSQLALPPDWAAPLCETSHRKTLPFCIQQATLMCKCMQENFRKAKITEPNEVATLKLSGLWIITTCFMELSSISCETMTSMVLIEKNPNMEWSYCFPVTGGRSYLIPIFILWMRRHWRSQYLQPFPLVPFVKTCQKNLERLVNPVSLRWQCYLEQFS